MFEYVGNGWHFQADEVARSVRDGKLQSDIWTHDKSLLLMDVFDEVRRLSLNGYIHSHCSFRFDDKETTRSQRVLRR